MAASRVGTFRLPVGNLEYSGDTFKPICGIFCNTHDGNSGEFILFEQARWIGSRRMHVDARHVFYNPVETKYRISYLGPSQLLGDGFIEFPWD